MVNFANALSNRADEIFNRDECDLVAGMMVITAKNYNFVAGRLVLLLAFGGCGSASDSKKLLPDSRLVATDVTVAQDDGVRVVKKGGISIFIPKGAFSSSGIVNLIPNPDGFKISTLTNTGERVLGATVVKDLNFCVVTVANVERDNIAISAKVIEGTVRSDESILNSDIEFTEIDGESQACWASRFINATFHITGI